MQFVRWTHVVCCCWTTGAFTSFSRWRTLPSQDVLLRRRLPNSPLLTWVAFPPHPGPLTLRHGLLLQGGWCSSTAAAAKAAGQPGMLVGVVQQFVIALLWVQYRSPSVPVIDGHGNDALQTRGSALVSSVHEKYRKESLPWSYLRMATLPSSVIIHFLSIWWQKGFGRRGAKVKRRK